MKIQTISLYQPDHLLEARLPGGAASLSDFIAGIEGRLTQHYRESPLADTARALVVALAPKNHAFWLLAPMGPAPELASLRAILDAVPRPPVVGGPIAFAMICNLGADFPVSNGPPIPSEWTEAARAAGGEREIDDILVGLLGAA